jgi:hypothetical protein
MCRHKDCTCTCMYFVIHRTERHTVTRSSEGGAARRAGRQEWRAKGRRLVLWLWWTASNQRSAVLCKHIFYFLLFFSTLQEFLGPQDEWWMRTRWEGNGTVPEPTQRNPPKISYITQCILAKALIIHSNFSHSVLCTLSTLFSLFPPMVSCPPSPPPKIVPVLHDA